MHQLGMSLVGAIGLSLAVGMESKHHRIPLEPELGPLAYFGSLFLQPKQRGPGQ